MANTDPIPSNFICPITHDIMENPVLLVEDGHSYEEFALECWFKQRRTSPITNKELKTQTFVVNCNLKSAIEEYCNSRKAAQSKLNFRSFTLHRGRPSNKDWKNSPKLQIIISLLGPAGTGKSCLATNVEYGQPQEDNKTRVTLAVDVSFFHLDRLFEDKYVVIVQINDCPGNDRFETVSDRHFRNCHGAVLMIDTTDADSLERLQGYWYKRLCDKSAFENVETVLACNKIDLLETKYDSTYREQFFNKADAFASQYQIPIFNISALRGDNVQAMFHNLIFSILQNPLLVKHLKENRIRSDIQTSTKAIPIRVASPSTKSSGGNSSSCC